MIAIGCSLLGAHVDTAAMQTGIFSIFVESIDWQRALFISKCSMLFIAVSIPHHYRIIGAISMRAAHSPEQQEMLRRGGSGGGGGGLPSYLTQRSDAAVLKPFEET